MKLTIQAKSKVSAKEGAQKWNVVLVAHKNMECLASYGSLAQGADSANNWKLVAQRGTTM